MITSFSISGETIYIDSENGNFSLIEEELYTHRSKLIRHAPEYSKDLYSTITFCLEISDVCNLNCSYCFNNDKSGNRMSFDVAKESLDYLFSLFPNAQKYFIDVSGDGEPLLSMSLIEQIAKYAHDKSNEIDREVTVSLVSNGFLLTPSIVKKLQDMNILFGVSIDGCKENHNLLRKDKSGKETFDIIMKNVYKKEDRYFIGCAVTITNHVFDLNESITDLKKLFNTISIKPARSKEYGIDYKSLPLWKNEYNRLEKRLESEIKNRDFSTLFALLNGDDYFGKFIYRSFLNLKALSRCDCATGRIAVSVNGSFYPCPALIDSSLSLGDNSSGFNSKAAQAIYQHQTERKECSFCVFRYSCGGECIAENRTINPVMCEFKKHLILLSMLLEEHCRSLPLDAYDKIYDFCIMKKDRLCEDPKLREYRNQHMDMSFVDAKKGYDAKKRRDI